MNSKMAGKNAIDRRLRKHIISIVARLDKKEKVLAEVMSDARRLIRCCSSAVNSIHRGDYKKAEHKIAEVGKELKRLKTKRYEDFEKHIVHVEQEYVEASMLLSIVRDEPIPTCQDLGVSIPAYLNGLLDCIGELRREVLECLIKGRNERAEHLFDVMEALYETLYGVHFPTALLPGFRVKQDVARRQVENARSEIFLAKTKCG